MNDPVVAFEFVRLFFGDEPPLFLAEIAFRTVLIYSYTLVLICWIGSRSIAQLSLVEFLLVIALGSAVGDAMFYPDVPLIHCMVVITVVVLLDKALSYVVARSPRIEDVIEGKSVEVLRSGVIHCEALDELNFGHDELFEQLRLKDVGNVGEVRAAYLETNGMVSVFKDKDHAGRAGLSIDPPWDVRPPLQFKSGSTLIGNEQRLACAQCATVIHAALGGRIPACPRCKGDIFHQALLVQ